MAPQLASMWWTVALRGALAIAFGISCWLLPASSLLALVLLFGAFAMVDGIFNLIAGIERRKRGRWGALIAQGILGIAVGILTVVWPGITALALLAFIAAWAVVTGVAQVAVAIRLRKQLHGEWLLILTGILSAVAGVLLAVFPGAGALAVVLWIGGYAVALGVLLLIQGFRLRSAARRRERSIPDAGVAHPA